MLRGAKLVKDSESQAADFSPDAISHHLQPRLPVIRSKTLRASFAFSLTLLGGCGSTHSQSDQPAPMAKAPDKAATAVDDELTADQKQKLADLGYMEADTEEAAQRIEQSLQGMSQEDLEAMQERMATLQTQFVEAEAKHEDIRAQLSAMSSTDLVGEKGRALEAQRDELALEIQALGEELNELISGQ